jgi:hypothetical protein
MSRSCRAVEDRKSETRNEKVSKLISNIHDLGGTVVTLLDKLV